MSRLLRSLVRLVGSLAILVLAACGGGGGDGGAAGGDAAPDAAGDVGDDAGAVVGPVEVPATTKILDDDTTAALESLADDGTLTFSEETALLASLEQGDVFVAGVVDTRAPHGFLRKVTATRVESDGAVVVETGNATLTDAIDRATIDFERALQRADVSGTRSHVPGVSFGQPKQGHEFGLGFSEVLVSVGDVDVNVNGRLDFDADLTFDLEIDKSQPLKPKTWVQRFEAAVGIEEVAELEIEASGSIEKQAEKELTTINIASIEFLIGPVPIVISVDLTIFLAFDGSLSAEVTAGAMQTASLRVGGLYEHPDGWSRIYETGGSFEFSPPTFQAEAEARAAAGARLAVGLYGEQGAAGTMTGRAFLDAEAATSGFPLWCLYGGLNASYGYQIAIPKIDVNIVSYDEVFAEFREEIGCADNNPPTVEIASPGDGDTFDETAEIAFEASASDAENSATLTWEVDGETYSGATVSVRTLCPGDHTVTVTAEDEQGGTTSASVTVTIENRPPDVRITEAPASVGETNDFTLRGTATNPTCDNLEGRRVDLDLLTWDLEDGFGGTGAGIIASFDEQGEKTVTLSFTDAGGLTADDTATVSVGAFDPSADPIAVINAPQDGATYDHGDLLDETGVCYRIAVRADASSGVADGDVVWSYREGGDADFTEFATGRETAFERSCNDIAGAAGHVSYDVRVHIEGEPVNDATTDTITIELQHLGG